MKDNEDVKEEKQSVPENKILQFAKSIVLSMKPALQALWRQAKLFVGKLRGDEDVLWDDESEDMSVEADPQVKLMYLVFVIYGFIAGFLAQHYAGFMITKFAAWAQNVSLAEADISSSPLLVLVSCVIVFCFYLAALCLQAVIFAVFTVLYKRREGDPQVVQTAFAYGVLAMAVISLISLVIPGNIFVTIASL